MTLTSTYETCGVDQSWQGLGNGGGSPDTAESLTVTLSWYQP